MSPLCSIGAADCGGYSSFNAHKRISNRRASPPTTTGTASPVTFREGEAFWDDYICMRLGISGIFQNDISPRTPKEFDNYKEHEV
jgi:hypothetical protein